MRNFSSIAAALFFLGTTTASLAQGLAQCEANFEEKGNFFTGTSFSTFQDFDASPDDLFKTTLFAIVNEGFQITMQDRDLGMISAAQAVTGGQGATAPLNVMIGESAVGSRARLTFSIAGGQMVMDARTIVCALVQKFGG